ncbi:MAG: hypothetical protein MIO92_08590 [Methanosarcinaceae archaeon]|nr:hypothetical protein [Methanosarcinaceae archaeon]
MMSFWIIFAVVVLWLITKLQGIIAGRGSRKETMIKAPCPRCKTEQEVVLEDVRRGKEVTCCHCQASMRFEQTEIRESRRTLDTQDCQETFLYKGESLRLYYDTPLESYFDERHPRPKFTPRPESTRQINEWWFEEWRGYRGVWEIRDGFLQLLKLQGPFSAESDPDAFFPVVFPADKPPLKATWVNGVLRARTKENMLELTFENGKLIKEELKEWPPSGRSGGHGSVVPRPPAPN